MKSLLREFFLNVGHGIEHLPMQYATDIAADRIEIIKFFKFKKE